MDGIAAVEARIGQIRQRIAQLGFGADPARGAFGAVLATAMERQTSGVTAGLASPSDASARMDAWLQQAIAITGVPADGPRR